MAYVGIFKFMMEPEDFLRKNPSYNPENNSDAALRAFYQKLLVFHGDTGYNSI